MKRTISKRIKNASFVVICFMAYVYSVSAQEIGVRGGFGTSAIVDSYFNETNSTPGLNAGLSCDFSISKKLPFYLETGVYYQLKGSLAKHHAYKGGDYKTKLSYVEVPLVLGYHQPIGRRKVWTIEPYAGVFYAYGVSGRMKDDLRDDDAFGDKGLLNRSDFGLRLGVGAKVNRHFYMGFNTDLGLLDILKSESKQNELRYKSGENSLYTEAFNLNIGYTF